MKEKAKIRKQSEVWAANCHTFPTTKWQTRKGILKLGCRDGCDSRGNTWDQHPSTVRRGVSLCISVPAPLCTCNGSDTTPYKGWGAQPSTCNKSKLMCMQCLGGSSGWMHICTGSLLKVGGRYHNEKHATNSFHIAVSKFETHFP